MIFTPENPIFNEAGDWAVGISGAVLGRYSPTSDSRDIRVSGWL